MTDARRTRLGAAGSPPSARASPPPRAARWVAAVATIGVCAGVVTLMLALASLLERLRDDPGTVGKRYQLTVQLDDASLAARCAPCPGVADAGPRYAIDAADSFRLGKPLRLVAYPGDHTRFEAPPLASGRRLRGAGEIEVGLGLADALGLRPGSTLAVQLPAAARRASASPASCARSRTTAGSRWAQPDRLRRPDRPSVAVRLDGGADRAGGRRAGSRRSARRRSRVGGATTRNAQFLGVLAAVLRGVGLAVGLVCLYALVQALAMTARERRGAVALLRACGGDAGTVALVLLGAAAAVALPGAMLGVVLEVTVLGPLVARLAAGFASLPIAPGAGQVVLVVAGLLALAAVATALVARRVLREPVVAGAAGGVMRAAALVAARPRARRLRRRPAPRARRRRPRRCEATLVDRDGDGFLERGARRAAATGPGAAGARWRRSASSRTRTCATRSRPRACRSSTGSARRSTRRSARRRRSRPRCSTPRCGRSTASARRRSW